MIALVCPEPAPWVASVAAAARVVDQVQVFAPWAFRSPSARLRRLREPLTRRAPPVADAEWAGLPGWAVLDVVSSLWARGDVDRTMRRRFELRTWASALAAVWLRRLPNLRAVIAPSCAARRPFAVARAAGASCWLVEDLPSMRQLQADLDSAAAVHPAYGFLRRYRAPAHRVAEQEAERVLATRVLVRSAWAMEQRLADGLAPLPLPLPSSRSATSAAPPRPRFLLAGLAAARHGVHEALAATSQLGGDLLVRVGEGSEPRELLDRPGVSAAGAAERERLEGITAVLAPAWCEAWLPEVALAAASGVAVVASRRAGAFVPLSSAGAEVVAGDPLALAAALERAAAAPRRRASAACPEDAAARLTEALRAGAR